MMSNKWQLIVLEEMELPCITNAFILESSVFMSVNVMSPLTANVKDGAASRI